MEPTRRVLLQSAAASALAGCASTAPQRPTPIAIDDLELVAEGLSRPEGIVVLRDGRIIVSSHDAACTIIAPDGSRRSVGSAYSANGLTMDRRGGVIVANYGLLASVPGVLQRVDLETGGTTTLANAIDGRPLAASNAPAIGPGDEIYCTHTHWADPYNIGNTQAAGFVYKVALDGTVSVVCSGIRGANGLCFGQNFEALYVAQTGGGDILRFTRNAEGGYVDPVRWGPRLGLAPDNINAVDLRTMPTAERTLLGHTDGLAADIAGNIWVTLPFAGKVVVVTPAGQAIEVVSDPEGRKLVMPTSLAFGGADRRDLYIASMRNNKVWKTRVRTPGLALPHWNA